MCSPQQVLEGLALTGHGGAGITLGKVVKPVKADMCVGHEGVKQGVLLRVSPLLSTAVVARLTSPLKTEN